MTTRFIAAIQIVKLTDLVDFARVTDNIPLNQDSYELDETMAKLYRKPYREVQ
jgi:hypothetical protein